MISSDSTICSICEKPLDVAVERYSENGKPIHEMCYINRLVGNVIPGAPNGSVPQNPQT
jgi:hypothetical protein